MHTGIECSIWSIWQISITILFPQKPIFSFRFIIIGSDSLVFLQLIREVEISTSLLSLVYLFCCLKRQSLVATKVDLPGFAGYSLFIPNSTLFTSLSILDLRLWSLVLTNAYHLNEPFLSWQILLTPISNSTKAKLAWKSLTLVSRSCSYLNSSSYFSRNSFCKSTSIYISLMPLLLVILPGILHRGQFFWIEWVYLATSGSSQKMSLIQSMQYRCWHLWACIAGNLTGSTMNSKQIEHSFSTSI